MKVAAIGEAMIELSMDGDHAAVGVAGDTLNTAIYLKRTAPAIQVHYVTRLGQEPFSRKIRDFIAAQRVDVVINIYRRRRHTDVRTGCCRIHLSTKLGRARTRTLGEASGC